MQYTKMLAVLGICTLGFALSGCSSTQKGAAIGAGGGAIVGGLIGGNVQSAAIGAAAGGLGGALIGDAHGRKK